MTQFGETLGKLTSDTSHLVAIANACDLAYCKGINNAYGPHVDFGIDEPEKVGQNLAGLQAVSTGVSMIASLRGVKNLDDVAMQILHEIASGNVSEKEKQVLLRLANCAWGAQQSLRTDKGPLGRATRVNFFDDLPQDEVAKDWHQIAAAAKYLVAHMS